MKRNKVLVVDDEPRLVRLVKANLVASGYEVEIAADGETALGMLDTLNFDLVVLDIMLPGPLDGFEVCARIREFSDVPVIMLTGKAREKDRLQGFDVGADDYLTKPFNVDELLRRVKAVLRRTVRMEDFPSHPPYSCGGLIINFAQKRAFKTGAEVRLTATEYRILHQLACHAGKVILHEELLTRVWGSEYRNELQYLRSYIGKLRKKIEDDPADPKYILGKHGIGYYLIADCGEC